MIRTTPASNISRACQIMLKAGKEVDLLCEALRAELSIQKSGYSFHEQATRGRRGDGNWLYSGTTLTFKVKRQRDAGRRDGLTIGTFAIMIDLYDSMGPSGAFGQAVIQVAWTVPDDYWELSTLTMPTLPENMHLIGDRLLVWDEERTPTQPINWLGKAWMYLLPLDAIRSKEDISRLLLDPVFKLIDGGAMEAAFDDAGEVLRFSVENTRIRLQPDAAPEVA